MKKTFLTALFLSLFTPIISFASNNWESKFNTQQLHNYFDYETSFYGYNSANYLPNRYTYYSSNTYNSRSNTYNNYRTIDVLSKRIGATSIVLRTNNIKLNRNERYSFVCNQAYDLFSQTNMFINYDDLDNFNRNQPRILRLNGLEPNTKYNCILSIQEEYKKNHWRLIGVRNNFSFTTNSANYNYDLSTIKGRRLSYENSANNGFAHNLNNPDRIDTEDISTVIAYKHIPKINKKISLVGPRYYQYYMLKELTQ